jgi:hypothetical protein
MKVVPLKPEQCRGCQGAPEGIEGHEWGTYVALERSFGAEQGIA